MTDSIQDLALLKKGDSKVYHIGPSSSVPKSKREGVRELYENGIITLVQRRVRPDLFEYIAQGVL